MTPNSHHQFGRLASLTCLLVSLGSIAQATSTITPIVLTVDAANPVVPPTLAVRNGAEVSLKVTNKSPFETCQIKVTREEIKEAKSPVAEILALLSKASVGFSAVELRSDALPEFGANDPIPLARVLDEQTRLLYETLDRVQLQIVGEAPPGSPGAKGDIGAAVETYKRFRGCQPVQAVPHPVPAPCSNCRHCADQPSFDIAKQSTVESINKVLNTPMPSLASAKAQLKAALATLDKLVENHSARLRDDTNAARLEILIDNLNVVAGRVELFEQHLSNLNAGRAELQGLVKYLTALKYADEATFKLLPDHNAKRTTVLTCSDSQTKVTGAVNELPVVVSYTSPPRISASTGVLISNVDKVKFGTEAFSTGVNDTGVSSFENRITETDSGSFQVVPFGLFHVLATDSAAGCSECTVHGTVGVGVNTNTGSTEADLFLGGSFGFGRFYLSVGAHFARIQSLANGFAVGNIVPADLKSTPIDRDWKTSLAFGLSYRLAP